MLTPDKKFAIGLSPLNYYHNDLEAFDSFCKRNDYRIDHWYSSLPCAWKRKEIKCDNLKEQKKNLKKQLTVINANNQKLQLAINADISSPFIKTLYYIEILLYKIFYEKYKKVDSLVASDEYIPFLRKVFPGIPISYSVQNIYSQTHLKNLKYCDTIVIGRKYLKNLKFIEEVKKKYSLKVELLLNCACNFACEYHCFNGSCEKSQAQQIEKNGLEKCVAWQSLFPSELKLYPENLVDLYKLSTRPSSLEWMEEEMNLYSSNKSLSELDFNYHKPFFWKDICCTKSISSIFDKEIPRLDDVLLIKSQLWSHLLGKEIHVY